MSSHSDIGSSNGLSGLADPESFDEGIRIEINVADFLWANSADEARNFYDKVIEHARCGKEKLS